MGLEIKLLVISFCITIFLSFIIIPILRKLKIGQIERELGPKSHYGKKGTPTMGGIIIAITIIVVGTFMALKEIKILPLVLVAIGFGLIGCIDDSTKLRYQNTKGISPTAKMIGLLIISVLYALFLSNSKNVGTDIFIPFIKMNLLIPTFIYIPFAICAMLATTNAINLTDGIDGLSTSVSMIVISCLTIIGLFKGITEIVLFGSIVAGACLGFLMFNLHPAKIFMGDTGSLLLGGVIVSMALYLKLPLLLLIIAIIPVIETLSVIIQVSYFKKTGKRIFKMAPIHHHFELCGWNESKIVSVFSIITLCASVLGILLVI